LASRAATAAQPPFRRVSRPWCAASHPRKIPRRRLHPTHRQGTIGDSRPQGLGEHTVGKASWVPRSEAASAGGGQKELKAGEGEADEKGNAETQEGKGFGGRGRVRRLVNFQTE